MLDYGAHQPFTLDPSSRSSTSHRGSRSWKSAIAGPQLSSKSTEVVVVVARRHVTQAMLGLEAQVAVNDGGTRRVERGRTGRSPGYGTAQSSRWQWCSQQAASQGCRNRLNLCLGQPSGNQQQALQFVQVKWGSTAIHHYCHCHLDPGLCNVRRSDARNDELFSSAAIASRRGCFPDGALRITEITSRP